MDIQDLGRGKHAFSAEFVAYVDSKLASESFPPIHPGMGGAPSTADQTP